MRPWFPRALVLVTLLVASIASADWPPEGKRVLLATDSFNLTGSVWIRELSSGDLLIRAVGVGGMSNGYDVQRISPAGDIAAGWPDRGASLGTLGKSVREWAVGFMSDEDGISWLEQMTGVSQNIVGAHLVDSAGVLAPVGSPGWPLTTVTSSARAAAFASAPGGLYAYFDNRLQRLTRSGAVAAGWPAGGRTTISSSGTDVAAIPDGEGGVVIMTAYLGPAAMRFDGSGVGHVGWPAGGVALSNDPDDGLATFLDAPQLPDLQPSDVSHYFAAWSAPYNSSVRKVKVQRLASDGTIDPAWPSSAVEAVASDAIGGVTLLPDRSSGLYVLWYANMLPRGTHIRPEGSFEPGTDGLGVSLVPVGASYIQPLNSYVPADVTPDGRLVFAWDDGAITRSIRVRWLLPDLTADPSEPAAGRLIQPNDRKTFVRAVHAGPEGGAYVAWECALTDPDPGADKGEVWMTRLLPWSLVEVTPPAPRVPALALSAPRPNPARESIALDVTLPDDSPARLELLDIAGRPVRTKTVQGAGSHAVAFEGLSTLAPGLYFARISSHAGSTATRVVVSR